MNCRKSSLTVIASYPCFEFWYLLHFGSGCKPYKGTGKQSAGDRLGADLRACAGFEMYDKGSRQNIFDVSFDRLSEARSVAPIVLRQAIETGELNPSTQVHKLIDHFDDLSKVI